MSLSILGIFLVALISFLGHFLFSIYFRLYVSVRIHHPLFSTFMELSLFLIIDSSVTKLLLVAFGTIERNPGPNQLKFATWNIDSLLTRDGIKKSMLEGLDSCHKFNIIGLCE